MKERPILFSAPMVRAILAGAKTQTRRMVKEPGWAIPGSLHLFNGQFWAADPHQGDRDVACPYGQPGDRLWVREAWMDLQGTGVEHRSRDGKLQRYAYGADSPPGSYSDEARKDYGLKWRPSIHMPRAASRITLEVTAVRVERLLDISPRDCEAEGVTRLPLQEGQPNPWYTADVSAGAKLHSRSTIGAYHKLWDHINGPGSWDANPWVWVVEFKLLVPPKETR